MPRSAARARGHRWLWIGGGMAMLVLLFVLYRRRQAQQQAQQKAQQADQGGVPVLTYGGLTPSPTIYASPPIQTPDYTSLLQEILDAVTPPAKSGNHTYYYRRVPGQPGKCWQCGPPGTGLVVRGQMYCQIVTCPAGVSG